MDTLQGGDAGPAVAVPAPREGTVHGAFEAVAAAGPGRASLQFGGAVVTYAGLNARANRLARHLRAAGVAPGTRVGVSLPRTAGFVAAWLAVLKAGGAYVPLDPGYPPDRLAFMLRDAKLPVLVVEDALPPALAGFEGAVVSLAREAEAVAALPAEDLDDVPCFPESLAHVLYTSGSTGTPKGIGITHRGVVRLARDPGPGSLGRDDRVAQVANTSFDAATWEVWGALLNGGTLVGFTRDETLAPATLSARLEERGITALLLTTALFNQVAREAPHGLARVRTLLFGGEASDAGAVRHLVESGGPERLVHAYGPTEATVLATWHAVDAVPPGAATVPIGRAVEGARAYVLDGAMNPVAPGETGELYVGGEGLARGYLGRPALTAERFLPSPFGNGERLYRTGDGVREDDAGLIEFVARLDGQVKIRGYRIELGEVEAALRAHPGVRDAVALVREDAPGERRLIACVVPDGAGPTPAELRSFLGRTLPPYMVPGAFVSLDAVPLTPNGKVDRRALGAGVRPPAAEDGSYVAPRDPLEDTLAAIWADVLGLERVGVEDSFFDLGGHSLRGTQIVARVESAVGVRLPVSAVFDAPTVAALARVVAERRTMDAVELLRRLDWLESLSEEDVAAMLEADDAGAYGEDTR